MVKARRFMKVEINTLEILCKELNKDRVHIDMLVESYIKGNSKRGKCTGWGKFNGPTEISTREALKIILLMDMENIIQKRITPTLRVAI